MNYEEYLKSELWQTIRNNRLRLAVSDGLGHVLCERCLMLVWFGAIEVHHKTYERLGNELLTDLEILCAGCHASHHGKSLPAWYEKRSKDGCLQKWTMADYRRVLDEVSGDPIAALVLVAPRVIKEEVQVDLTGDFRSHRK